MPRLPQNIDFDASAFPELSEIFLTIDAGIAAIVAADPTMRPKPALHRRKRANRTGAQRVPPHRPRRAAA